MMVLYEFKVESDDLVSGGCKIDIFFFLKTENVTLLRRLDVSGGGCS